MNFNKSNYWSKLTEVHLQTILRVSTVNSIKTNMATWLIYISKNNAKLLHWASTENKIFFVLFKS